MRQNTGQPYVIAVAAAYPTPAALPTADSLDARIAALQQKYPVLAARLVDARTRRPYLVPRQPFAANEVIIRTTAEACMSAEAGSSHSVAEEDALVTLRAIKEQERRSVHPDQPMWSISLVEGAQRSYMVLSLDHVLIDGGGALRLLHALVAPSIDDLPSDPFDSPIADATIPLAPSMLHMLPIVLREIVLPRLPALIRDYFKPAVIWPVGAALARTPLEAPAAIAMSSVPAELLAKVKAQAKAHGVRTLHPVLLTAYMASVRVVHCADDGTAIRFDTPRGERAPALGHPYLSNNYVSGHHHVAAFTASTDVWATAAAFAAEMSSPAGIAKARYEMGMLAYVPDPDGFSSADPRRATGWEDFFLTKSESDAPFGDSGEVSNLGLTTLPAGADDMLWAHSPSVYAAPYQVSVVSHEGGLRLAVSFRDGCATSAAQVDRVNEMFGKVLERMAVGLGTVAELIAE